MQGGIPMHHKSVQDVIATAKAHGLRPVAETLKGQDCNVVEIQLINYKVKTNQLSESIFMLPGVENVRRIKQRLHVSSSIQLGSSLYIGKEHPSLLIAGPCTVDQHVGKIAKYLKEVGIKALRGGCWKCRSNPYTFRGYGNEAVYWLLQAAAENEMEAVFTEVMLPEHIATVSTTKKQVGYKGTVVLWIGANTQSDLLLDELGSQKEFPVMLKNNASDRDIKNLIKNTERVLTGWNQGGTPLVDDGLLGNSNILLCLRGTQKSGDPSHYRQNPNHHWATDLKDACDAPIGIDPSHSAGTMKNDLVIQNCKAALLQNPDFLLIEGGYPANGFENGSRGKCDVDQTISQERLPEVIAMINHHNSIMRV